MFKPFKAFIAEDLKQIRKELRRAEDEWGIISNKHGDDHPLTKKALRKVSVLLGKQEEHFMQKWDKKQAGKKLEESTGMKFDDAITHAKTHGNRVTYGTASKKWHSIGKDDRDYHTSFALDPDEAKRHGQARSLLMSTQARKLEESVGTAPGGGVGSVQMDESGNYKVGDRVHMGLAVKGGAGHIGTVDKIEDDMVHVKLHGYGRFGDRVVKGHKRLVSPLHEEVHAPGTTVRVPHKGKMVSGKVVRHDKGDAHGSPFYVVDVGEHESPKVPAHKVEKFGNWSYVKEELDVPTLSPEAIAKKHEVSVDHIEAQLKKGIEIEKEHTTDEKTAREIALDHLGETPDYYSKLDKAKLEEARTPAVTDMDYQHRFVPTLEKRQDQLVKAVKQLHQALENYYRATPHTLQKASHELSTAAGSVQTLAHWVEEEAMRSTTKLEESVLFEELLGWKNHPKLSGKQLLHNKIGVPAEYTHEYVATAVAKHFGGKPYKNAAGKFHIIKEAVVIEEKQYVPPQDHVDHLKKMGFVHSPDTQLLDLKAQNSFKKKGSEHFNAVTDHLKQQGYTKDSEFKRKYGKHANFISPDKKHRVQVDADKMSGTTYTHFNANYTKLNEDYKVGDTVVPKIGPHKGHPHEVIHVHGDGKVNIKPKNVHPKYNRYHLGAATADPKDLESHMEESKPLYAMTQSEADAYYKKHPEKLKQQVKLGSPVKKSLTSGIKEAIDPAKLRYNKYANEFVKNHPALFPDTDKNDTEKSEKKFVPNKKVWKKMPALSKLFNIREGLEKERSKESEEARKELLKRISTPKKPKVDESAVANNPIVVEAFKSALKKKKLAVKPEKLEVNGPGVNDRFQKEPIVTPLTSTFTRTP